ncbi:hypothetical protein DNTS_029072 [Danionella cerebrum]|uniref:G-protein coupled receptors family 1 profile domain-containing protein n=1 Tax=Danionella cerebrum TaxID=2873325 RepID=A0A553NL25_9TELE|nr:hypothetical protein DNTS_029072 [Danionella translucida]
MLRLLLVKHSRSSMASGARSSVLQIEIRIKDSPNSQELIFFLLLLLLMDVYSSKLSPAVDYGIGAFLLLIDSTLQKLPAEALYTQRCENAGVDLTVLLIRGVSAGAFCSMLQTCSELLCVKAHMSEGQKKRVMKDELKVDSEMNDWRRPLLSILGNVLVLVMACKRWSHMKPPELLSVNLAVTDLGAAVSMYPLAVASAWNHHWIGGDATCIYYGLMGFFFGAASMMTITIMAVVRFIVSLTFQSPKEKISKRNAQLLVAATWLYALLWAIFPLIGWGKYGPESFGLSCTLAWREMKEHSQSFIITIFLMNLVLPALIIISCYSGIALRLYVTYKNMDDSNHIPNMIRMQRRLMLIAVLISVGFVGCWVPYGIVSLWSIYRPADSIPPEVSMLPCLFAKSSTVYNPFIYYIFSKTFKREVNQFGRLCGRSNICNSADAKNLPEKAIYLVCDDNQSRPGTEDHSSGKSPENETQLM